MPGNRAAGGQGKSARDVERELARAQGARRLLPWAFLSSLSAGAIVWAAGGGPRGGAAIAALGLIFVAIVWTSSIARCPSCGVSLPRRPYRGADPAAARPASCPHCRTRFE